MNRRLTAYRIIGKTFGVWLSTIFTGLLLTIMKPIVSFFLFIDKVFINTAKASNLKHPIIIVGNPRSGTTFLQRYLINSRLGIGSQLWQLIYPSILLQKIIKPFLPLLEKISPARHHSTEAHKTSLTSVETDDVSLLFRHFDGFFLYGFIFAFDEEDLFEFFDPMCRDTSIRDFEWFEKIWRNNSHKHNTPYIGKLFSLSSNLPAFQKKFPDSKVLYMVRDPIDVIPSGLSLVTGVLDKRFGFWNLDKNVQSRYIKRLYNALVTLLMRFHHDWVSDNIDKSKVLIIRYDKMMSNFEIIMNDIFSFLDHHPSKKLISDIQKTAEEQRIYKSKHKYDLKKFGLSEKKIKKDCLPIYETFLT